MPRVGATSRAGSEIATGSRKPAAPRIRFTGTVCPGLSTTGEIGRHGAENGRHKAEGTESRVFRWRPPREGESPAEPDAPSPNDSGGRGWWANPGAGPSHRGW